MNFVPEDPDSEDDLGPIGEPVFDRLSLMVPLAKQLEQTHDPAARLLLRDAMGLCLLSAQQKVDNGA